MGSSQSLCWEGQTDSEGHTEKLFVGTGGSQ